LSTTCASIRDAPDAPALPSAEPSLCPPVPTTAPSESVDPPDPPRPPPSDSWNLRSEPPHAEASPPSTRSAVGSCSMGFKQLRKERMRALYSPVVRFPTRRQARRTTFRSSSCPQPLFRTDRLRPRN